MARQCQRPGCTNTVKGAARFCAGKHKAEDHRDRRREQRKSEIAQLRKLARKLLGLGLDQLTGLCTCTNCDGKCKRKRGRPRKSPRA